MKAHVASVALVISGLLGSTVVLSPAVSATVPSPATHCAQGRPATYKVTPSDGAFLKRYISCLLASDGLSAHAKDRIPLYYDGPDGSFAGAMAPTVAGFANAPSTDQSLAYINSKLAPRYDQFSQPLPRSWYTIWADTTPPAPTLNPIASYVAKARTAIEQFARTYGHHADFPQVLAIDVVVQKGVWFHDGTGNNLRYMVLFFFRA